jgi:conjugative transfer region protein (TIGR03748 family)
MAKRIWQGLVLLLASKVGATELPVIKTDRYTVVQLAPSAALMEPLSAVVQLKFPGQVLTVQDAMNYVLDESGYALVDKVNWTPEMEIMLSRGLPVVQRDFSKSPMPIMSVLEVLAGPAFTVVQDPLRRLVTFELKAQYRGLIDG